MRSALRRARRLITFLLLALSAWYLFLRRRVPAVGSPGSGPVGAGRSGAELGAPGELPDEVLATDAGLTELPDAAGETPAVPRPAGIVMVDEVRVGELLARGPDGEPELVEVVEETVTLAELSALATTPDPAGLAAEADTPATDRTGRADAAEESGAGLPDESDVPAIDRPDGTAAPVVGLADEADVPVVDLDEADALAVAGPDLLAGPELTDAPEAAGGLEPADAQAGGAADDPEPTDAPDLAEVSGPVDGGPAGSGGTPRSVQLVGQVAAGELGGDGAVAPVLGPDDPTVQFAPGIEDGIEEPTSEIPRPAFAEAPSPAFSEAPTMEMPVLMDDLRAVRGIGPSMERMLHGLGIVSFRQLALLDGADLDRVRHELRDFRSRIEREDWIGQARQLHKGKYGTDPS